ncbi:MAG: redox-sensing transcriptional repressor Rex [Actinomycetales bacterium mxb001]|nr:MAG: redox-sensing transcriptional repressor Rex [Actinomycetales bacterium mxb001]
MPLLPPGRPDRVDDVPTATLERLPVYLQVLAGLADQGIRTVSSTDLAEHSGVTSAKLRKDLSLLGSFGTRGVGYDVVYLHGCIADWLGVMQPLDVVVVGVGNLGQALASYQGLSGRGFRIIGLVDIDPSRVGQSLTCGDTTLRIRPLSDLVDVARHAQIGVIATPDSAAQSVCDRLVSAGVRSILTFAPSVLRVPAGVEVRRIDVGVELQILGFRERRQGSPAAWQPGAVSA